MAVKAPAHDAAPHAAHDASEPTRPHAIPDNLSTLVDLDPEESAAEAGLRYISDDRPGIRRRKYGKGFRYLRPDGSVTADARTLKRIRSLAIPPAWTDVWIATDPRSHIQATGLDAKGRKQYRYHPHWREVRDEAKFGRMLAFGRALPAIRERVRADLAQPGLPREKVLAAIVRLLETTLIRVGNEEYARENHSYGLTTLRTRHVKVDGSQLRFSFTGKSGKVHKVALSDRRLARIVKTLQDLPGQEIFQYVDDDGEIHSIDSADVNQYLRDATGQDFTAKDFRTWAGTVLCSVALHGLERADSPTQAKKNVVQVVKTVAQRLGNTPAVCRSSYIHPAVIEDYLERCEDEHQEPPLAGGLDEALDDAAAPLDDDEREVMRLLRNRLGA